MFRGRDSDVAAAGAAMMIATHVGLRATRDALFLSEFDIDRLPAMVVGASLFSLVSLIWTSGAMARWTPAILVPSAFAASALLLAAEWLLAYAQPTWTAVVLYLHVAALGAFLVSGFWSVINERFDPRTARRKVGRIAAGAAFGGLLGGLLAERMGAYFDVRALLPLLGVLHLATAGAVYLIRPPSAAPASPHGRETETVQALAGLRVITGVPYLRNIALLVLTTTAGAVLLDYVFKARALSVYSEGADLVRFFAVFYAATGLGTFLVQTTLGRRTLERFGLAGTVGILPAVVGLGSAALLGLPGLLLAGLVRGSESVVRSSLFRSGYELLYTPVPVGNKRAAKPVIDVGVDKVGDGIGAGLVALMLLLPATAASSMMLGAAVALSGGAVLIAGRLRAGYVDALKSRLVGRAEELAIGRATDSLLMQTMSGLDLTRVLGRTGPARTSATAAADVAAASRQSDPVLAAADELRCGVPARVKACLEQPLDPILAGQVITLLGWDEVSAEAQKALRSIADKIVGQLTDALVDPASDFAVRRRIPGVLAVCDSERAVDGLVAGLGDRRFEVRFRATSALARIRDNHPHHRIPEDRIHRAIVRELRVGPDRWRARDFKDSEGGDRTVRSRTGVSLEHVFRLLGLILEKEPLQIAFRGLHTDDAQLRGTALEYLESVLPVDIRDRLWPFLDQTPAKPVRSRGSQEEARSNLLRSETSIDINLAALQARQQPPD